MINYNRLPLLFTCALLCFLVALTHTPACSVSSSSPNILVWSSQACPAQRLQSVLERVLADSNTTTQVGTWLAVLQLASEQNQLGC